VVFDHSNDISQSAPNTVPIELDISQSAPATIPIELDISQSAPATVPVELGCGQRIKFKTFKLKDLLPEGPTPLLPPNPEPNLNDPNAPQLD
jgi:hypothetical protein